MQKTMDWLQSHTLIAAIIIFIVIFVAYNAFKKKSTTAATTATGIPPGTGVGGPTGTELYNSQLYQYPTYQQPVIQNIAPSPSTTPGVTPPSGAAPASTSVYHGLLSVLGSIHPANIGPWTAGRTVNVAGATYSLAPGAQGRLWGVDKATGKQINLWDGNDYAGGPRTAATIGGAF